MKRNFILLILVAAGLNLSAQDIAPEQRRESKRIYGKIVDASTKKGIEAASIQLFIYFNNGNTIKDSLAGGMLSKPNGDFNVDNLPASDSIRVEISAIGYESFSQIVQLGSTALRETDLGNIALNMDARYLGAVTVVGQKPALQMGVDRKTFNVDKSITATGGTAVDVMKNIPSVSVDVDGNVTLRSNTPQIFVDGLPTILTLDQIPADNIERIELFTNPSAKFDASSRGGIINIILKKNRKNGLNGVFSAGGGHPDILNSNLTLNLRQGKLNFFVSGNYNQGGGRARGTTERINKSRDSITNYFNQYSWTNRMRQFGSLRFGFDLFADNRNTITVSQNFVKGRFTSNEDQEQEYFSRSKVLERTGDRNNRGTSLNNRSNTQVSYKYKFVKPGKEFSADATYNTGRSDDESRILNLFFQPDGAVFGEPSLVRNEGASRSKQFTFQADFVNPGGENEKTEMGIRTYINNFSSAFNAFSLNNGTTKLPLSNNYASREVVNAGYVTYSNKIKSFAYQLGVRFEHSEFTGELLDSARKFGYTYPSSFDNIFDALFPSVFLTKTVTEGTDIQLNYTRRVRRPNFWQLNPFININDPVNLEQGNPQLQPEFTNSLEFNISRTYNTGNFLGVLYFQNNQRDITRYSDTITNEQFKQLNNAAIDPNAILNTFINARATNRWGMEFTYQQNIGKNFDITPSIDLQYRKVIVDQFDLSNEGFNWEGQIIANYRIDTRNKASVFNKLSFQVMGEYESQEVTPQGKNLAQYGMDFAVRKDFLKGNKASFTFNINDVFNSKRFGAIYDTEAFYQEGYRRRNVRSFRVTFTYRFGSSDFNLFKRPERRDRSEDDGGDTGG